MRKFLISWFFVGFQQRVIPALLVMRPFTVLMATQYYGMVWLEQACLMTPCSLYIDPPPSVTWCQLLSQPLNPSLMSNVKPLSFFLSLSLALFLYLSLSHLFALMILTVPTNSKFPLLLAKILYKIKGYQKYFHYITALKSFQKEPMFF